MTGEPRDGAREARTRYRTKVPKDAKLACNRERYIKPGTALLVLLLGLIFLEAANPYGASSASAKLSREAFNAIMAPWYDHAGPAGPGVEAPETGAGAPGPGVAQAAPRRTPPTPQQASIVLLIDDSSLEDSKLTWPLAASQLYYKLQALAEEHRPAAVFLDVLLTHERPDPRIAPEVRAGMAAQKPQCDFFDIDPAARVGKLTQRSFANLAATRAADDPDQAPLGPPGIERLVDVSDRASAFWCLKYHYRPVDGPTYPVDYYGPDNRYGTADDTKVEPRIPLIMAVPNLEVSRGLSDRLISAEKPGDFAASRGSVPNAITTEQLRQRLLVPGLRGVATPAVVQTEIDPGEPGTIPLKLTPEIELPNKEKRRVPLTTPAAASLVAFCRHHPQAPFPGCREVHAGNVDTLSSKSDRWRWERKLFLKWGVTSARTESYVKHGPDEDDSAAAESSVRPHEDGRADRSRADICVFSRDALARGRADIGWGGEVTRRLAWSARTLVADLVRPDRPGEAGSVRARCSYIPTMKADLNYWPIRPTKLMQTHPDGPVDLGDLIDGRVVFIGTNFDIHKDRTRSPVHETLPGVFQHAMAFDNLLRAGADWRGPAAPLVDAGPGAGGHALTEAGFVGAAAAELLNAHAFSLLDVSEIIAVAVLGFGGLAMREWLSPTRVVDGSTELSKREAAWEPILALCVLLLLVGGAWGLTRWPAADLLMVSATLMAHYRERLWLALEEVLQSFARMVLACRREPWRIAAVLMLLFPVALVIGRVVWPDVRVVWPVVSVVWPDVCVVWPDGRVGWTALYAASALGVVLGLLAVFGWAIRRFVAELRPQVSALSRRLAGGVPGNPQAAPHDAERDRARLVETAPSDTASVRGAE